jgi:hypothetical protein
MILLSTAEIKATRVRGQHLVGPQRTRNPPGSPRTEVHAEEDRVSQWAGEEARIILPPLPGRVPCRGQESADDRRGEGDDAEELVFATLANMAEAASATVAARAREHGMNSDGYCSAR